MSLKLNERYPARFNNPTVGYPQGSFKNRTTPTAKDGSYLEKDWANDKEGFFQSLLAAVGATANGSVDKVGASQFFDSLIQTHQQQIGVAFTTTGTATAQVLTPTPAIPAYSVCQRFNVTFNTVSGANPTINVSGIGAKSLKQYDSTGAKVAAVFYPEMNSDIVFDGVDWVVLSPIQKSSQTISYLSKSLLISTTGLSSSVSCSGGEIILTGPNSSQRLISNFNLTLLSFANSGANGLDVGAGGSQTVSTWYSVWVISNGTTVAGLLSLSGTSPTMPAGYTEKALVGWVRTNSTTALPLGMTKRGGRSQWTLPRQMSSGVQGSTTATPTWIPVSVAPYVAPGASAIDITAHNATQNTATLVAPNNSYQNHESNTLTPLAVTAPTVVLYLSIKGRFVLESNNIFYASTDPSGSMVCTGFED